MSKTSVAKTQHEIKWDMAPGVGTTRGEQSSHGVPIAFKSVTDLVELLKQHTHSDAEWKERWIVPPLIVSGKVFLRLTLMPEQVHSMEQDDDVLELVIPPHLTIHYILSRQCRKGYATKVLIELSDACNDEGITLSIRSELSNVPISRLSTKVGIPLSSS